MGTEYHLVFNLSSAKATLDKAETLISLAKIHPEISNTLAACAALLLAATLEQGTKSALSYAAKVMEVHEENESAKNYFEKLYKDSLRTRVKQLPSALTDNRFRLIPYSPIVKHLHKLIDVRNLLLHIEESAGHLVVPSEQVIVEEKGVRVETFIPLTKNPWSMVSIRDAENFLIAVKTYLSEVVFPESGQIKLGMIVCPVS